MPFPVIVGPTAGGKSALAMELARAFEERGLGKGEIVSCDSIQIYRGLDIGSAKPSPLDQEEVPHHLIDIIDPTERFSVADWYELVNPVIESIRARGNVPILVGGTHLYVKIFMEGLFQGPQIDRELRESIRKMDPRERRAELERVDPAAAARIHFNDERRTIRAIEVYRLVGTPISELQKQWDRDRVRPDCRLIGLDWPTDVINLRINARVKAMLKMGLFEEVRSLLERGLLGPSARTALGYRQIADHLEGQGSLEDAIEQIKVSTRKFGKAQRTWLRRLRALPDSIWLDAVSDAGQIPDLVLNALCDSRNSD